MEGKKETAFLLSFVSSRLEKKNAWLGREFFDTVFINPDKCICAIPVRMCNGFNGTLITK